MPPETETDFRWQPQRSPRSKLAAGLLMAVGGLVTWLLFVGTGLHPNVDNRLPKDSVAKVNPSARSGIAAPSSVATTAPLHFQLLNPPSAVQREPARDEPSAFATEASLAVPNPSGPVSSQRYEPATGYATLRQALLRKIIPRD